MNLNENIYRLKELIGVLKEGEDKQSEQLKSHIDSTTTGGGDKFTDIDLTTSVGVNAYSQICQKFITSRGPNPLGVTGKMMADAAKQAFNRYRIFVPAELALAQLAAEGGVGATASNPKSKPIRTKNPFNVGNVDSGAVVQYGQVQSAVNKYYDTIAKEYLNKNKTAKDLLSNFVNKNGDRYASAKNYESTVSQIAKQANAIAQPIIASLRDKKFKHI